MVNFEDGELVKGAYVVIDGKEYEVHMPQYSGKTPLSSENLNKMQVEILKTMLPVGSRYVTQDNTNPSEILGFGTWERLKGKVCLGLDEDDTDFNTIGKTGGAKTQQLRAAIGATHGDTARIGYAAAAKIDGLNYTYSVQGSNSISNVSANHTTLVLTPDGKNPSLLQTYEVVGYMWIRRA